MCNYVDYMWYKFEEISTEIDREIFKMVFSINSYRFLSNNSFSVKIIKIFTGIKC